MDGLQLQRSISQPRSNIEWCDNGISMVELVDLAWGREVHLGLNLNEEPMEKNNVDD